MFQVMTTITSKAHFH